MALTDFPPIPAELAGDAPPITDDELEAYFAFVDEHEELGVEGVASSLDDLAEHPQDFRKDLQPVVAAHRFRVDDDAKAEWALRRLAAADADVERLRLQAEDWSARITAWFQQAARRPAQTAAYMTGQLERYGLERRAETGTATLTLPSGVVSTRKQEPVPVIDDDDEVADWIDLRLAQPPVGADEAGLARWRAWRDAVAEAAPDPTKPLLIRSAKVYADRLRKLVRIEQQPTGILEWTLSTSCEHEQIVTTEKGTSEPAPPKNGEVIGCPVCDDLTTIVAVSMQPLMEPVVVGPDGVAIPGAVVRPGEVKASVKVR